ncbi:MAG: polyprenyl synthetase family protein [Neomegalonema sp.]|nr:polyprenyl synthetase family protein [Neomegalonema sp.]
MRLGEINASADGAFELALRGRADEIEAWLERLLPLPSGDERRVVEAMRYVALGPGKRLRGFLVVETAKIFGCAGDGAMRAAAAIECLHGYSLAHDDLPAMDDDALRRGRPTAHIQFDEATAILAGDALQTAAFEILLDPATAEDPARRVAVAATLARLAGSAGMVGGQMIDILAESRATPLSADEIRRLQAMKTGALISASAQIGAILGGASAVELRQIARYGDALGAAFQIADDLLDEIGDEAEAGKQLRKDIAAGKATLPNILGMSAAQAEAAAKAAEAEEALQLFGDSAALLRQAARFAIARRR